MINKFSLESFLQFEMNFLDLFCKFINCIFMIVQV
jgi:hypothetical protein